MKNYKEIEQRSTEWHEIRWAKIGGILSKGLFVKSDTLFIDILSQKFEEFELEENTFSSNAMERGVEYEPFAIVYLEEYYQIKFEKSGWLQSEENELLGISPDGIGECETFACEVKCFGRKKHMEVLLSQEVPNDNIFQLIHYFVVNPKLEKLYFMAFRPEAGKHFMKIFTPETVVNIGTAAKPKIYSIAECVLIAKAEAAVLLKLINAEISKLKEF